MLSQLVKHRASVIRP